MDAKGGAFFTFSSQLTAHDTPCLTPPPAALPPSDATMRSFARSTLPILGIVAAAAVVGVAHAAEARTATAAAARPTDTPRTATTTVAAFRPTD
jgi:hypothetical protein